MLRERFDRNQRLKGLSALPVVGEFLGIQPRPLANDPVERGESRHVDDCGSAPPRTTAYAEFRHVSAALPARNALGGPTGR